MSEKVMLVLIGGRSAVPPVAGVLQFLDDIDKIKFLICQGEQFLQYQKKQVCSPIQAALLSPWPKNVNNLAFLASKKASLFLNSSSIALSLAEKCKQK